MRLDRIRACLAELNQLLDQLEAEMAEPKRKRKPATPRKTDTAAAIAETRRRLRGAA